MLNLILSLVAKFLFLFIAPISFVYVLFIKERFTWKRLSGYWRSTAISIDRYGNYEYRSLWNATLKTESGYEFGDFRETLSSALGKNQRDGTLSKAGRMLANTLDWLDKEHCKNSITNF